MSNPSKQRGTAFETAVVNYLQSRGIDARRVALAGANDGGDVRVSDWTLEAKARKVYAFGEAVDQAKREGAHAGTPHAEAVIKRVGKGDPARAFVVLDLEQFAALVLERGKE
jgi:hypothetical protein